MRYFVIILFLVIVCGCNDISTNQKRESSAQVSKDDSLGQEMCRQKDTITPLGTMIKYISFKGGYKIAWGDRNYQRIFDTLYTCEYIPLSGLWDDVPKYYSETKNYLVFNNVLCTSSGGNPAPLEYYVIVFPKNVKDAVFEEDYFINCIGNYLIFGDDYKDIIHVRNLETGQQQTLELKPKSMFIRTPTLAIDSTFIEGDFLNIKYETWSAGDSALAITRSFRIEI